MPARAPVRLRRQDVDPPDATGAVQRIFAPSEKEIERSRKIISAFEEAQAAGQGVVTVDGRMIENLHVDNARRILALAEAIGT